MYYEICTHTIGAQFSTFRFFFSLKIYDVSVSVGSILVCHFVNIYSFVFCLKERWFFRFSYLLPFPVLMLIGPSVNSYKH